MKAREITVYSCSLILFTSMTILVIGQTSTYIIIGMAGGIGIGELTNKFLDKRQSAQKSK